MEISVKTFIRTVNIIECARREKIRTYIKLWNKTNQIVFFIGRCRLLRYKRDDLKNNLKLKYTRVKKK